MCEMMCQKMEEKSVDPYVYINEVVETVKEVPGLVCNQISGCRVWWDANGVEFCPSCTNK